MVIHSYEPAGYTGTVVSVEVDIKRGIPGTDVVGLAGQAAREARDRVRVAVRNSGFVYPLDRILVSLAPSDVPKSGAALDLAIALAVLAESNQALCTDPRPTLAVGELHLGGAIGPVRGVIAALSEGWQHGIRRFVIPAANREEARSVPDDVVFPVRTLAEAVAAFGGRVPAIASGDSAVQSAWGDEPGSASGDFYAGLGDYRSLRGQPLLKRAIEVAVAGGHHLLLVGPPGSGKSMAASLIPSVLPPLDREEAVEVTRLHSLAGALSPGHGLMRHRPFRAPHHGATAEGILGGGRTVEPGEASLAHRGVLFLDEAPEFRRNVLQGLREPLEERRIRITRAGRNYWFPASVQLVLACNPCPCGLLGREDAACLCGMSEIDRYWRRIGGALIDRIDLRVRVSPGQIVGPSTTCSSAEMLRRIRVARVRQRSRYTPGAATLNGEVTGRELDALVPRGQRLAGVLAEVVRMLRLSSRGVVSILRLARTIADMDDRDDLCESDLLEAAAHRRLGEESPIWMSF